MTDIRLNAQNLDLLRQIDADQNGEITSAEAAAASDVGLLTDENAATLREDDRLALQQVASHPGQSVPLTFAGRHGQEAWTEAMTRLRRAEAQQQGLPETLMQTGTATVGHGTDPGDYYCEHVFYAAQSAAILDEGQSVVANQQNERLVGFLHVPEDAATEQPPQELDQAARHRDTRQIVGAALRGYYETAAPQVHDGPVRILLTGFGPFEEIRNNPTGDFVRHPANSDAAMAAAFGDRLLSPRGQVMPGSTPGCTTLRYQVRDTTTGQPRAILVQTQYLQVGDRAFQSGSGASVQDAVHRFQPHAVLSLGVNADARPGEYLAENHADNAGIADGHHDEHQPATISLPANYALARAIHAGHPHCQASDQ